MTTKPSDAKPAPPSVPAVATPPVIRESSQPEIFVSYMPAGRETLEAIAEELVPLAPARARESSSPEISVRQGVVGRETLAAIAAEAAPNAERAAATALEIFELCTFVVRGTDAARLASENLRRAFVEEHLFARLPVASMTEVERIDVTPWTAPGTLVVRVWCKAGAPSAG